MVQDGHTQGPSNVCASRMPKDREMGSNITALHRKTKNKSFCRWCKELLELENITAPVVPDMVNIAFKFLLEELETEWKTEAAPKWEGY